MPSRVWRLIICKSFVRGWTVAELLAGRKPSFTSNFLGGSQDEKHLACGPGWCSGDSAAKIGIYIEKKEGLGLFLCLAILLPPLRRRLVIVTFESSGIIGLKIGLLV